MVVAAPAEAVGAGEQVCLCVGVLAAVGGVRVAAADVSTAERCGSRLEN